MRTTQRRIYRAWDKAPMAESSSHATNLGRAGFALPIPYIAECPWVEG